MEMVRGQLERDPPPPLAALYGRAVRLDPEIRKLTLRQFNAKYPLQVKRRMAPKKPRRRRPARRKKAQPDREAIRDVLVRFARDVAAAEGSGEVIDVITGVDKYVDEVVKAAGRG